MKYIIEASLAIILIVGVVAACLQMGYEPKEETTVKKEEEPVVEEEPPEGSQATLPKEFEKLPDPKVGNMRVGDVGYQWASSMRVDENKKCWLRRDSILYSSYPMNSPIPGIKITRTKFGYEVESLTKDYKWYASKISYVKTLVPVYKFTGYKE